MHSGDEGRAERGSVGEGVMALFCVCVCLCVRVGKVLFFGGCGYVVGRGGLVCELVIAFSFFFVVRWFGMLDEKSCLCRVWRVSYWVTEVPYR